MSGRRGETKSACVRACVRASERERETERYLVVAVEEAMHGIGVRRVQRRQRLPRLLCLLLLPHHPPFHVILPRPPTPHKFRSSAAQDHIQRGTSSHPARYKFRSSAGHGHLGAAEELLGLERLEDGAGLVGTLQHAELLQLLLRHLQLEQLRPPPPRGSVRCSSLYACHGVLAWMD